MIDKLPTIYADGETDDTFAFQEFLYGKKVIFDGVEIINYLDLKGRTMLLEYSIIIPSDDGFSPDKTIENVNIRWGEQSGGFIFMNAEKRELESVKNLNVLDKEFVFPTC